LGVVLSLEAAAGSTEFRVAAVNSAGQGPFAHSPSDQSAGTSCAMSGHGFVDVAGSFAEEDISCIKDLRITTGTSTTTYSPADPVTREQMAAFIARTWEQLGQTCPSEPHGFNDVPDTSFANDAIGCIKALGITTGTSSTTYSPADLVTREQMAAFIARMWTAAGNQCPTTPHGFNDVPATSFANDAIGCIKALGITTGTSTTTYSPANIVTREQMAAFIARTWRAHWGI
jgi:hypothetical protein